MVGMEREDAERIIRGFVTNDAIVAFLCALEGSTLAVYPGEMAIGQSVTKEIKEDMPLAALTCPGSEYFNIEEVTDEVVHDVDAGIYMGDDGHVLELEDVIWDYMEREDLEIKKEQIIKELLEDWEDRQ
jgi:hypothetical protein